MTSKYIISCIKQGQTFFMLKSRAPLANALSRLKKDGWKIKSRLATGKNSLRVTQNGIFDRYEVTVIFRPKEDLQVRITRVISKFRAIAQNGDYSERSKKELLTEIENLYKSHSQILAEQEIAKRY